MNITNPADPNAIFQQAVALHGAGRLIEASGLYRRLLELLPNHPAAQAYLGMAEFQLGNLEESVRLLQTSVQIHPAQPEAFSFLGSALQRLNRLDGAVAAFDRALALRPDFVEVLVNRGFALRGLRRLAEALASCDRAISLAPTHAEALNNRGLVLQDLGRHDEARAAFEGAIALMPNSPLLYNNLANSLQHLSRFDEALASVDRAIALNPAAPESHCNRASVLRALDRASEALASCDRASALDPDYADAHGNRGNALQDLHRADEALASYDRAIALKPDDAEVWYMRGVALTSLVQLPQAMESYRRALAVNPEHAKARWASAFLHIPEIFAKQEEVEPARAAFAKALEQLDAWFTPSRMDKAHEVVGLRQPFYLAYQERANKVLLSRYGEICNRLMAHWQRQRGYNATALSQAGKIRIGIVSAQIRSHSVWHAIIKGWIKHLDPGRFEIHLFYPGGAVDTETLSAQSMATTMTQGKRSLDEWVRAILDARIEVMIYPEIGMDALTTQLGSLRLAPVQLASWGHPETTGLKTMDYYVSATGLEPENAEGFYSEKLVRLPHLGCSYSRQGIVPSAPDMARLGLKTDAPLLICPGSPFKYAPEYDWVLVEIAKRLGKCQFVFFTHTNKWLSLALAARLRQAFEGAGLDFDDYGVFIPWLKHGEFYGLMQRADVFLDTLGFSGFNTAMQAVECALPIAALDGRFMRGRLASGILKRMGMPELVASSGEGYISLATRLAQDKNYRDEIRGHMKARQHVLYDDAEPVRAFGEFLARIARPAA